MTSLTSVQNIADSFSYLSVSDDSTLEEVWEMLGSKTVKDLKIISKEKGLTQNGIKKDLVARVFENSITGKKWTVEKLKIELRKRNLKVSGKKSDLATRLCGYFAKPEKSKTNIGSQIAKNAPTPSRIAKQARKKESRKNVDDYLQIVEAKVSNLREDLKKRFSSALQTRYSALLAAQQAQVNASTSGNVKTVAVVLDLSGSMSDYTSRMILLQSLLSLKKGAKENKKDSAAMYGLFVFSKHVVCAKVSKEADVIYNEAIKIVRRWKVDSKLAKDRKVIGSTTRLYASIIECANDMYSELQNVLNERVGLSKQNMNLIVQVVSDGQDNMSRVIAGADKTERKMTSGDMSTLIEREGFTLLMCMIRIKTRHDDYHELSPDIIAMAPWMIGISILSWEKAKAILVENKIDLENLKIKLPSIDLTEAKLFGKSLDDVGVCGASSSEWIASYTEVQETVVVNAQTRGNIDDLGQAMTEAAFPFNFFRQNPYIFFFLMISPC